MSEAIHTPGSLALSRLQASRLALVQAVHSDSAAGGSAAAPSLTRVLMQAVTQWLFQPAGGDAPGVGGVIGGVMGDRLRAQMAAHPARSLAIAFSGGLVLACLRPWRWRLPPTWALALLTQSLLPWLMARTSPTSLPPPPNRSSHEPPLT